MRPEQAAVAGRKLSLLGVCKLMWRFPKVRGTILGFRGTILGVPMIRTIVCWGLIGVPLFRETTVWAIVQTAGLYRGLWRGVGAGY